MLTPDPPEIVRAPCHVEKTMTLTSNLPQVVCIEIVKQGSSEELGPKPGRFLKGPPGTGIRLFQAESQVSEGSWQEDKQRRQIVRRREDGIQEGRLSQTSPEKVDTKCDSKAKRETRRRQVE